MMKLVHMEDVGKNFDRRDLEEALTVAHNRALKTKVRSVHNTATSPAGNMPTGRRAPMGGRKGSEGGGGGGGHAGT